MDCCLVLTAVLDLTESEPVTSLRASPYLVVRTSYRIIALLATSYTTITTTTTTTTLAVHFPRPVI